MRVKLYVATVAALAVAAAAVAAVRVPAPGPTHVVNVVLLLALVSLSEWLNVRYYHADEVHAFNLMEGILATLIFVGSGSVVVAVTALGLAVANAARRNPPLKSVFNVAQWVFAASLGSLLMDSIRPSALSDPVAMPELLAVMVLIAGVNFVAMSGVLKLATGSAIGSPDRRQLQTVLVGHAIGNLASFVTGLCLAATYVWNPWAMFVGVVVVVGMHMSGRANASLRADGVRLAGLQRATHALATSLDVTSGLPQFLAEVRAGFEVRTVELVLFSERGASVHRCGEDGRASCVERPHPLAQTVAAQFSDPARIDVREPTPPARLLEDAGHSRVLAVPLRTGAAVIGALLLYDRIGLEGFESGELAVAEALGREVVSFIGRVELLNEIDEERRKLADILGATSDGICAIESDGTITSWNAGLAAITGFRADEVVGTRHFGLLRPRDAQGRDVLLERWPDLVDQPGTLPTDLQIVTAAGAVVWLSCSYSRIAATEGRHDVLVVVARNVTQSRELERLKDDFVAVVSHELRTPLVPIKGWAQTLLNRGERLSDAQRRTAVQSILSQAQKLESLVLNILEASRIEARHGDGEGVTDVFGVVTRLVDDLHSSRPERVVRLRPPSEPCPVNGSSVWVERAVSNLIANAVKYSPDDQPVDVAVAVHDHDVHVRVTDHGPGIPLDAQERIFERFERLEETLQQTGTGLGLYITRRLARAMGGDVTVSSVPGAGSTFLLRLPRAQSPALPELPGQRVTDDASDGRPGNVVPLR